MEAGEMTIPASGSTNNALVQRTDPAVVAQAEAAKAMVQAAFQVALYNPRNEDEARARLLRACQRPEFAAVVEYSKPIGNKKIKGPSIRFAEAALRHWKNTLTDIKVIYEDELVRRCRVMVLDLESNTTFSKEFQIQKTVERRDPKNREILQTRVNTNGESVYIVAAYDDELRVKENAMISIEVRNQGLRLIPEDITREAMEVARATRDKADSADPDAAKRAIIDAFAEYNIFPKSLEEYLGHPLDIVSIKEIDELRSAYLGVSTGETSWIELLAAKTATTEKETRVQEREERKEEKKEAQEELKGTLNDRINKIKEAEATRIEDKPEKNPAHKATAKAADTEPVSSLFGDGIVGKADIPETQEEADEAGA